MKTEAFTDWIKQIYAAGNDMLDCDETQATLPAYVDALQAQGAIDPLAEKLIESHLANCPDCNETFDGLKFVAEQAESIETSSSQTAVAAD